VCPNIFCPSHEPFPSWKWVPSSWDQPCEQWLLNPGWLMIIGDYTTQIYPRYWGILGILNTAHVSLFLFWRRSSRQSHDFMFDTAASKIVEAPPSLFHDLNATNPRSVERKHSSQLLWPKFMVYRKKIRLNSQKMGFYEVLTISNSSLVTQNHCAYISSQYIVHQLVLYPILSPITHHKMSSVSSYDGEIHRQFLCLDGKLRKLLCWLYAHYIRITLNNIIYI
jgi:hypothetical protein